MGCSWSKTAVVEINKEVVTNDVSLQLGDPDTDDEKTMHMVNNGEFLDKISCQSQFGASELAKKKKIWQNLDFFVLDNSLRETTVAQISSHTLSDKQKIFNEIKKCGFRDIIVASFSSSTRVDDKFVLWLKQTQSTDFDKFYSFSEISVGIEYDKNGNSLYKYNNGDTVDDLPDGMKKNKLYGLKNTIFEADFGNNDDVKWGDTWTVDDMCKLIEKRIMWAKDNISKNGKNFLNMRDIARVMRNNPKRMFEIIKFVARMPKEYRLVGMIFEEPAGDCMPEEVRCWCRAVRDTMNFYGWKDGLLLNHIHAKMGYKDVITMDCLANGCNGIWAAVCEEGAAVGHCSSAVTILNLIRHGNSKVIDKYNCSYLRQAAIEVTKITTKTAPHPKQIVYGERATDLVFGAGSMGTGKESFDLAKFFGMDIEPRITTLATPDMIVQRLEKLFGKDKQFTTEIAILMKDEMIKDLSLDIKSEYHSPYGLALLFERVGGKPTKEMGIKLEEHKTNYEIHHKIRQEIWKEWDKYTIKDVEQNHGTGSTAVLASLRRKSTRNNLLLLQKSAPVTMTTGKYGYSDNFNESENKDEAQDVEDDEEQAGLLTPKSISIKNNNFESNETITGINETNNYNCRKGEDALINSTKFLTFDKFYHGFMQPYFGCYRCSVTKNALKTLDADNSGTIEWFEFVSFVDWTLNQYSCEILGNATNVNEMAQTCLKLTFEKAIIPAMRDRVNEKSNPFAGPTFRVIHPKNYVSHTATFIFLHGISDYDEGYDNGTWWYNQFSLVNVQKVFPYIRFVFPTANKMSITDLNDSVYTAWFDINNKSNNNSKDKYDNIKGLNESIEKVQKLIFQEINVYNIASNRIMLGGFNQGGVMAIISALSMNKEFAAITCCNAFLFGNSKQEWDKHFKNKYLKNNNVKFPIHWDETLRQKFYQDFDDDLGRKCVDYLQQDCQLKMVYTDFRSKDCAHLRNDALATIETMLINIIKRYLPQEK